MTDPLLDTIVIGGGFFGSILAEHCANSGARVVLLEAGPELLGRASALNQARVHVGYHYPRSFLTAYRSRINAPRFTSDFKACIHDSFTHYYAIGRLWSNVTAAQFRRFCERIGAPLNSPPAAVRKLFNPDLVEDVFQVPEYTFDVVRLRALMERRLAEAGVEIRLGSAARRVTRAGDLLEVTVRAGDDEHVLRAARVFNCTYAGLNRLHAASGLPLVPLKHELTEMALVEPPSELADAGVTVMCGPFFSLLPYPARGLCTLSHVRYTPHLSWTDAPGEPLIAADALLRATGRRSAFPSMVRDAARFIPAMAGARQVDSLWEIKTVLPRSEMDDSRPILVSRDHGLPGFHCVIGSKMDNVYDMIEYLGRLPATEPVR